MMAQTPTITLRQNRRWAWGTIGVMMVLFVLTRDSATWASVLLSAGLMAVLLWVTWPMLPDWRFDEQGVWRGRVRIARWSDVQSVDVRTHIQGARQLGSIDVVMRTPAQPGIYLRLYCQVEAHQVMQMFDKYLPEICDRTPIVSAVDRVWPAQRPN
ncbi:MAG: hypothetical protein FJ040_02160 [Chloroflexi bacterium]|nr:hypothetical protein [Chloroflexota bacterium]